MSAPRPKLLTADGSFDSPLPRPPPTRQHPPTSCPHPPLYTVPKCVKDYFGCIICKLCTPTILLPYTSPPCLYHPRRELPPNQALNTVPLNLNNVLRVYSCVSDFVHLPPPSTARQHPPQPPPTPSCRATSCPHPRPCTMIMN